MKKILLLLPALAFVLAFSSCRRAAEKARRNIRVEAVEAVERHGLAGFDLTLRVKNGTGYKLVLRRAELGIFYGDAPVGDIALRDVVEVPRRATVSVATRWRIRISDPLALYMLLGKLDRGDVSQAGVSFAVEGRGGPAPINISQERMPLSDFLSIFGLSPDDVKKHLEP